MTESCRRDMIVSKKGSREKKTEERKGDYRSMMIRHCNEVLATQKGIFRRWFVGPTFFKSRMVSGAEASENPGLARETWYALFKRLCACSSFTVFTYVLHTACVCAWRHCARRAAPEDTGHASLHARCGRTPDTGQLQRASTRAIHPRVRIPCVGVPAPRTPPILSRLPVIDVAGFLNFCS